MLRRPWFQVHLSTAIVLMFVAGGLLWANATPQVEYSGNTPWEITYGWPYIFHGEPGHIVANVPRYTFFSNAAIDFGITIVLLIASATVCELLLRRREARAP